MISPVDLALLAEHRRGHGALYDALNQGRIDAAGLRRALAMLPQPEVADGRLVLAVDVSAWPRPDTPTSPDRLFRHVYGLSGRSSDQLIPGWPYSFVAAPETGRTSWCQLLDAVRLGPDDKPDTWGEPDAEAVQVTDRYGTAQATAWDRIHPRLTTRSAWIVHDGELPVIEGTLIRLQVDHLPGGGDPLPGGGDPLPVWLWSSLTGMTGKTGKTGKTGMTGEDVDLRRQAFLRRFDLEHTLRFGMQTLAVG